MADFDKDRIDALLRALQAHDPDAGPVHVLELARQHQLDPMIVRRLAESEGLDVVDGEGVPEEINDTISTGPIDLEDV